MWSVLVSGEGMTYKMNVGPRWETNEGDKKAVGVEILEPSLEWIDFLIDYTLGLESYLKEQVSPYGSH
jgi:hypothetical protein